MTGLPLFEGVQPLTSHLVLSGKVKDHVLQGPKALHLDEEVTLVVCGHVSKVAHELDPNECVVRVQTVKVEEAYAVDATDAERLVDQARRAAEMEAGVTRLSFDGDTGEIRR